MDYVIMGRNIRDVRKTLKMTQEKLSDLVDLSTVFISQIENGSGKPSLETMYKISLALNIPIDDLVKNTDKDLTTNVSEINSLLTSRSNSEIQYVTAVVRTILDNLKDGKITI
jgi:transcriptional regulator with XRE-family HTH domain